MSWASLHFVIIRNIVLINFKIDIPLTRSKPLIDFNLTQLHHQRHEICFKEALGKQRKYAQTERKEKNRAQQHRYFALRECEFINKGFNNMYKKARKYVKLTKKAT